MSSEQWSQDLDHSLLERVLFDNGLSFLRRSMQTAAQESPSQQDMTHAAVELAVAIEILLKARLVREHWALVCVDIGKNTKQDLRTGKAKTVTPEAAVARLRGVADVDLDLEQVKSIVDLRNRAAHFTLATTPDHALHATFGRGLTFIRGLIDTQFADSPDHHVTDAASDFLEESHDDLARIDSYVTARLDEIEPGLQKAPLCLECPTCHQPALVLDEDDGALCRFCSTGPSDEQLADLYVEDVLGISAYHVAKDGDEWPVLTCYGCGQDSLVEGVVQLRPQVDAIAAGLRDESAKRIFAACFTCGLALHRHGYSRCYRCSRPAEYDICPDCAQVMFS